MQRESGENFTGSKTKGNCSALEVGACNSINREVEAGWWRIQAGLLLYNIFWSILEYLMLFLKNRNYSYLAMTKKIIKMCCFYEKQIGKYFCLLFSPAETLSFGVLAVRRRGTLHCKIIIISRKVKIVLPGKVGECYSFFCQIKKILQSYIFISSEQNIVSSIPKGDVHL